MPQIKKEDTKSRLYCSAKKEFLMYGFHGANLRAISKSADMSLANVYSYAKDKDDLFKKVLIDVIIDLDKVAEYFKNYHPAENTFDSLEIQKERMRFAISYIYKNRIEFSLLLNRSSGSSLEDYPEKIVDGYSDNCKRFLTYLKEHNPKLKFEEPSDFFFKSVARFALKAIGEMLKQRLSIEEMEKLANEIVSYNFYGFRGLAEVDGEKK
ncbi:MAG: TetR/AcrR family transcriptional regulator [Spirirestis rafaelensis WJT71-NPBG6]|nr:TetR/AcrR family transcriptional regulator [Spirirestis rafaelensis WJT71-NPBG6]